MNPVPLSLLPDTAEVRADGSLAIGGCSLLEVAAQFGTPAFVYDEAHLRARCREAVAAFGPGRAVYATKAFLCGAMARLAYDEGMLLDVASGGELYVALHAGVPADALTLHGNNKSTAELRMAIEAGVRHIVVDSHDELDRLDALHAAGLPAPKVIARITPGVHAHTHEFIATGQDDSKFGFNLGNGDAQRAVDRMRRSASVQMEGVHCHIGSNVFEASSFAKAAEVMALGADRVIDRDADLVAELGEGSVDVVLDLVGGPGWPQLLDILKRGGRYAISGAIAGPLAQIDLRTLYLKDLTLYGATFQEDEVFETLVHYIEAGRIRPVVARTYPLKDIIQAQKDFLAKGHVGKLVLIPPSE